MKQPELFERREVGHKTVFEPVVGRITQLTNTNLDHFIEQVRKAHSPDRLPDLAGQPPAQNVDTSIQAADSIRKLPKTKRDERLLLAMFKQRQGYGLTDDEIKELFNWDGDYERPRRWSLVKQGLVRKSELRRLTVDGNPAIVWVAVL